MIDLPLAGLGLTHRALAMLRAVAAGRTEITCSCEPDMFVDGLPCCHQAVAHALVHAGLVRQSRPGSVGRRVRAVLTPEGHAILQAHREAA